MKKDLYILLTLLISFCSTSTNTNENSTEEPTITEVVNEFSNYVAPENKNIINRLFYKDFSPECIPYLGSTNPTIECLEGVEIIEKISFEGQIVNLTKFNGRYFISTKLGRVYEFITDSRDFKLIIDISENVDGTLDRGLKGFAVSTDSKSFAISYINKNVELVVDLYSFDTDIFNSTYLENLITIEKYSENESISWHYGGHIIWSETFNGYVIGVGDFKETGGETRLNKLPLDLNQPYGKLLLLNKQNIDYEYLVLENKNSDYLKNVIGIGLRNPWQFFEFKGSLIVPDVGYSVNEEISISNLNKFPINFAWPIYEGMETSKDIDGIKNYKIDLDVFIEGKKVNNIFDFSVSKSLKPLFTYNHNPIEDASGYRGAIVGGDIFVTSSEKYRNNLVFVDHMSGEIFLYNITNGKLFITPSKLAGDLPTALKIYDEEPNSIIVTTYNGELKIIKLPS